MTDFSERIAKLSPKRLALLALELQKRLEAYEHLRPEPIAIIGMGCRFPGGADSPAAFWRLLHEGRDASRIVPPERWDAEALYDADPATPGKMYTRRGSFLDGIDRFDAGFFGISPREAVSLDPQQRLLLEVAWEAVEDAGIAADKLMGSATGVFIGACHMDYLELFEDFRLIDAYVATGSSLSLAAGRLSYVLGAQGPALTVDTACSSSLVALHLACQSLRAGECKLALVGGTNLVVTPKTSIALCELRALSPDGRCKTFDASADGYGRGEGCGIVVLKRLADATTDGDRILAVVRGTAVNQDGRSGGLTAPNGPAQEAVLRQALTAANVEPTSVGYVETHGTGTSLGDPIEVQALAAVYGQGRETSKPLLIGSVKTNVGHLEAAAGVAGVIKVILSLRHREVPPHLHLTKPNPYIPWSELPIRVPTSPQPWNDGPRVAALSSFGFSGTNAHAIIEEAPPREALSSSPRPVHLLPLSARSVEALREQARRFAEHLKANSSLPLEDVCHTASVGRVHLAHRLAVVAPSLTVASEALSVFANGETPASIQTGHMERERQPKIAFLFTGQGSQYAGMARQLYETSCLFRATLDRCAEVLQPHLDRPLLDVLHPADTGTALLDQTAYTQPALFAVEYALAILWQSWGVRPDALLGHSLGEYVAACVGGVLSLEDALTLVVTRSRLMQAQPAGGGMAAVFADEKRVSEALRPFADRLSIAALNGPALVVLSGQQQALDEILGRLERDGVRAERLRVSHAFHSPLMETVLEPFRRVAENITHAVPRIPIASNLTGRLEQGAGVFGADYWCNHLRQPVRFEGGMQALRQAGIDVLVEIGPAPVLLGMGRRCLPEHAALWLPSLRRGRGDWEQLLESLAGLYARGIDIDWPGFAKDTPRPRVSLPTYPFQRERYWVESVPSWTQNGHSELIPAGVKGHPALGRRLRSPLRDVQFESSLSVRSRPALADHRVYDTVVVPASWHVALLLTAAVETGDGGVRHLDDLAFPEAIVLPDNESRTIQLIQAPAGERKNAQVLSLRPGEGQEWTVHATGSMSAATTPPAVRSLDSIRQRCPDERNVEAFYQMIWGGGIQLDERFRWVAHLQTGESEACCRMRPPQSGDDESYALPPGLIDSCFQLVAATIPDAGADATAYVPFGIDRVIFTGPPRGTLWAHAVLRPSGESGQELHTADIVLFEENGKIIAAFEGLHLKRARREALLRSGQELGTGLYEIVWRLLPAVEENELSGGPWLIVGEGDFASSLANVLRQRNEGVQHVPALGTIPEGIRSVVFLSGLAETDPGQSLPLCGQALALIQAVLRSGMSPLPRLVLVTRGAQFVGQQSLIHPAQAPLWGLGRTLRLEHPELHCLCLDLDPDGEPSAENLLRVLASAGREDQVVLRGEERLAARLVAKSKSKEESLSVRAEGCYLITGGLTGLGLLAARWLVEQGARLLVLAGRRTPSTESAQAIRELEEAGASVLVVQADVADAEQVARLLRETANVLVPLRGVIHAAGVLDNAVLLEQDEQKLARVLAPKVAGAWNIHTATRELPLDFFVLFSSVAAVLGSPGQANYAAANAFLDALAHQRRLEGLSALSVNWGPWAEIGMAARVDERQKERWETQGVEGIPPAEGMAILGRLLVDPSTQATVLRVRWNRFLAQFPAGAVPPILAEMQAQRGSSPSVVSDLLQRLEQTPAGERANLLLRHVAEQATRVLRLGAGRALDPRQPLNEMGMDSLMAVELRNRLGSALGRTLSATLLFNYPTIEKLARYLAGELAVSSKPTAAASTPIALNEPIAIIGIGCRLPGAGNPDEYWQMLRDGVDAVKEVPADRWDVDAFYDADPEAPGKMYTRRGGFLGRVDGFDAAFFGIAPREAVNMDPQQRLLLEVAWEALEDAALAPERLASTLTAVYVGISTSDYSQLMLKNSGLDGINAYTGTGSAFSVAAGRISYVLGLQGPNFPVDTACSSSLLAVHLACQSLRTGESSLALACGVNLILTPEGSIYFCKLRATSPDGQCKTFDASANGYVRGEGCGVVVLKRLSDALRDGDRIQAVIRGSAVNHDGRSNGLTAPNGAAQEAVIRQALLNGGVQPEEVSYIEAHGTGTPLGDPIELQALASVLGRRREPLLVGSVKTNIGHLEAGAGVASLIKVVLALRESEIPPHLHFRNPNPLFPWAEVPVRIVTERMAWPAGERKRLAGVSSFGFSGTNVHVIVEEAPASPTLNSDTPALQLVPLSAHSAAALRQLAGLWGAHLKANPSLSLADVAFTARAGRAVFAHRLAIVAASNQEAQDKLLSFAEGRPVEGLWNGEAAINALSSSFSPVPVPDDALQQRAYLEDLARRFVQGELHDWQLLEETLPRGCKIALPTYPFERQRFWIELKEQEGYEPWRDWLYELAWEPAALSDSPRAPIRRAAGSNIPRGTGVSPVRTGETPVPPGSSPLAGRLTGRWLLFRDTEGCGAALARSLEERGTQCLQVTPGTDWQRADERHWQIDPANVDHFRRLLTEVRAAGPLAGVVFLWGLNDGIDLESSQRLGCGAVLHLVQGLLGSGGPARLWLVSRNTQATHHTFAALPFQSPLWGLGRVLALEHPELHCVRIDLDNAGVLDQVESLVAELTATDGEDQVAYRGRQRLVARLVRSERKLPNDAIACEEEGCYLIAGGTGALGLQVARWLVGRGARHIALLSRRGGGTLEALPATVRVLQGDVASADDVRRVLQEIERDMPPLRGVIHAAGVLDDGVLLQQDWPRFERVLAPKVAGAWNLHEQTRDRQLDFFVLFSSAASLLGSPGQGNYAVANAFLDALAHHRRALGLAALSVNWSPWAGAGMAAHVSEKDQRRIESQGLRRIDPVRGLEVLGRLMASDAVQVGVLPVDWNVFFRSFTPGSVPPVFRALAKGRTHPAEPESAELAQQLQETPAPERLGRLRNYVAAQVQRVMGQSGPRDVPAERPLMELGMDSLMAVELRNVLGRAVQAELPATLLFDHPTVSALATHLAGTAFATLFPSSEPEQRDDKGRTQLLDEVEQLSQDDMESLIAAEFSRLKKP